MKNISTLLIVFIVFFSCSQKEEGEWKVDFTAFMDAPQNS